MAVEVDGAGRLMLTWRDSVREGACVGRPSHSSRGCAGLERVGKMVSAATS